MPNFICTTCGSQHADSAAPPPSCAICDDARQYVGTGGRSWTTLEALRRNHRSAIQRLEPALTGIGMTPDFAIAQRALLVQHATGNVLWDCVPLLDAATVDLVRALGGLSAIAVSHPHFYATVVEWSRALGDVPIYLHIDDRQWMMRPDPVIRFWEGETLTLGDGLTLIRAGGHFAGGTLLHWRAGAEGRGALLSGDIVQVAADPRWVSFMYSYPNMIPLPPSAIHRIVDALEPLTLIACTGRGGIVRCRAMQRRLSDVPRFDTCRRCRTIRRPSTIATSTAGRQGHGRA